MTAATICGLGELRRRRGGGALPAQHAAGTSREERDEMTDLMNKLAAVVAAASLAITPVWLVRRMRGVSAETTEMLAEAFSGNATWARRSHDELVQAAAAATRDYTSRTTARPCSSMLHAINESAGTIDAAPDESWPPRPRSYYRCPLTPICRTSTTYLVGGRAHAHRRRARRSG